MNKLSKILYVMAVVSGLGALITKSILREWVAFLWIPIILGVGFAVAAIFLDRKVIAEFLGTKTTKQGMSMGMMIFLVVTFMSALNFYGAWKYKTWDFSLGQTNSLSEQSVKLLADLKADLKVVYFYQKGTRSEQSKNDFISLVKRYQDQSSFVKLEFYEVNERPDLAEQYGVKEGKGLAWVEYNGKKSKIEELDEQRLTGAMAKHFRDKDRMVYFVEGHGESDISNTQPGGLGGLKGMLEENRYLAKPLNLVSQGVVPVDADLVAIVGPKDAFMPSEIKALEEYLIKGGSLMLALEQKSNHGLSAILGKVGIEMKDNYVLSKFGEAMQHAFTPLNQFGTHTITKPFGKQFVVFRLPGSLVNKNSPAGMTVEEIITAGQDTSVAVNSLSETKPSPGPFVIGYSAKGKWAGSEASGKDFNIVVYADADFLLNDHIGKNLNRDLAMNSLTYLAKEENMITVTPKEVGASKIEMTQAKWIGFLIFVVGLPLGLLAASGFVWSRRRFA